MRSAAAGPFLSAPSVPHLGLGLASLGRPGYINLGHGSDIKTKTVDEMRAQCWEVLDAAFQSGVRYFDAARSYGKAEEFLSGWLKSRAIEPGSVLVGSKWGYYYTADWKTDTGGTPHEIKEHTASRLASQQDETAQLLGPYLNLYQIHSATLDSGVLQARDVLDGLEALKRARGWRIGLSLSGVAQAETLRLALSVRMSDGRPLFDCVQATWNLLEQSAGAALTEAHQQGVDVIVKEGLANGRLTSRNTDPTFATSLGLLTSVASELGCGVDALALACVMAQPFKPMVLSGASTPEQLRSNYQALEVCERLDASVLARLQKELVQASEDYWKQRSQLAWN